MSLRHALSVAALVLPVACGPREAPIVEVPGACADVYGAQLCTWAQMKGDSVLAVGADVPLASIANAPQDMDMSGPPRAIAELAIPEAAQAGSGTTHLTMYWEAHGHPPGAFMTPHFDFHFYTVPVAERQAIDCVDRTKPAELPSGYALPDFPVPPELKAMFGADTLIGICVPGMGMHSLLETDLTSAGPLTGSMVLGYIHGKLIFVEPMIAKDYLMAKKSFDLPIPSIPGATGVHPQTFRAEWDEAKQSYRFMFGVGAPAA